MKEFKAQERSMKALPCPSDYGLNYEGKQLGSIREKEGIDEKDPGFDLFKHTYVEVDEDKFGKSVKDEIMSSAAASSTGRENQL